jgi:hypothetical protein
MTDQPKVIAEVLDLFGAPPRPVRAWRPTFYVWTFAGCPIPPDADAVRQATMMRADTLATPTRTVPADSPEAVDAAA